MRFVVICTCKRLTPRACALHTVALRRAAVTIANPFAMVYDNPMESVTNTTSRPGKVSSCLGRLPEFWPHETVFFANLECIFFGEPEKTRAIMANVRGFEGYGSRMIPILGLLYTGGVNLLLQRNRPHAGLLDYFSRRLGLALPDIEVVQYDPENRPGPYRIPQPVLERIRRHPATTVDGYVTDAYLEYLGGELGKSPMNTRRSCRAANDKILLHDFLAREGLPAFDGGKAETPGDLRRLLDDLAAAGYRRAAVRSSLGASGFGMAVVDLTREDEPAVDHIFSDGEVLVQGWIEEGLRGISRVDSPSVQFFCGNDGRVTLFDLTEQLLSRHSVHEGNVSPPYRLAGPHDVTAELLRQSARVAEWVASTGYRGTGSVDFLVCGNEGASTVYTCEVNARVTGASYPSILALHFRPGGAWLMRNVFFGACMDMDEFLAILDRNDRLFEPSRRSGVIPLSAIETDGGGLMKSQVLFLADTPGECMAMIREFPNLLPPQCRYERD